jgi:hypothetical protein
MRLLPLADLLQLTHWHHDNVLAAVPANVVRHGLPFSEQLQ